jgi:hypothetical protein
LEILARSSLVPSKGRVEFFRSNKSLIVYTVERLGR